MTVTTEARVGTPTPAERAALTPGRHCSLCQAKVVDGEVSKTRHAATGHIRRRRACPECGRSYFTVELRLADQALRNP